MRKDTIRVARLVTAFASVVGVGWLNLNIDPRQKGPVDQSHKLRGHSVRDKSKTKTGVPEPDAASERSNFDRVIHFSVQAGNLRTKSNALDASGGGRDGPVRRGEVRALCATSVIEVGVDAPAAAQCGDDYDFKLMADPLS